MGLVFSRGILLLGSSIGMIAILGCARPAVVPSLLTAAEGLAEDVQSDLEAGNWMAAEARLDSLRRSRNTVDSLVGVSRYGASLDSLGAAIARRASLAAREAANQMSRALVVASANYRTPVPAAVGFLDVAGREVGYAAEAGNWSDAERAVAELQQEYSRVSSHVRGRDPVLADRMEAALSAVGAAVVAKNAPETRRTAVGILEAVDSIEATFP